MCAVSVLYDYYHDKWQQRLMPTTLPAPVIPIPKTPALTPEEIAEFRVLLEKFRDYDKRTDQPDCELDEKRQKLKKLAKELGVEIAFI